MADAVIVLAVNQSTPIKAGTSWRQANADTVWTAMACSSR